MNWISRLFSDIRFWIGITFVHRLFSIMQPPLEAAHNWRQTTVNMVARNFLEIDPNIFYPRVDMAGELTGITGMEFPLLNYLIYLVSLVFGYDHWYGRLINLVVSSVGIWCFYDLLKHHFHKRLAFNASMVLLFSLFYYYSRKIMPDIFSVSLVLAGIWMWKYYISTSKFWSYLLGGVFILFGVLSKLPSVMILAFLWPLMLQINWKKKLELSLAVSFAGIASVMWYFYWVPYLENEFGFSHFFMGKSIAWTFHFLIDNWQETLHMFYVKAAGYSGFIAAIIGLGLLKRSSMDARLIVISSVCLFLILMLKSGDKFIGHEYYIIPFVPLMALLAGLSLSTLKPRILIFALVVISVEGVARKWEDQFVKSGSEIEFLDEMLDPFVGANDLIVVNSGLYPTPLYFAHRKGWITSNDELMNQEFIEELAKKGCKYIVIMKQRFGSEIQLPYTLKAENQLFVLYQL